MILNRIIQICNNSGSYSDGIGHFSFNLALEFKKRIGEKKVITYSAQSGNTGFLHKISSLKMTSLISHIYDIQEDDVVIIEYPFAEINPLVLFAIKRLSNLCKQKKAILIISLHEYFRVNFFRKFIINQIVKYSNFFLVTDNKTKLYLENKNKVVEIREIPSNIISDQKAKSIKSNTHFVYLGLINKTKAFKEMIEGWKIFNIDKKYHLTIISSSEFENNYEDYNIHFKKNLSNEEIYKEFSTALFCILPIKPSISVNNATYKTCLDMNCIPIGVFESDLSKQDFIIQLKDYTPLEFSKGLQNTTQLTELEIKTKLQSLNKLTAPTFSTTAQQYLNAISLFTK